MVNTDYSPVVDILVAEANDVPCTSFLFMSIPGKYIFLGSRAYYNLWLLLGSRGIDGFMLLVRSM